MWVCRSGVGLAGHPGMRFCVSRGHAQHRSLPPGAVSVCEGTQQRSWHSRRSRGQRSCRHHTTEHPAGALSMLEHLHCPLSWPLAPCTVYSCILRAPTCSSVGCTIDWRQKGTILLFNMLLQEGLCLIVNSSACSCRIVRMAMARLPMELAKITPPGRAPRKRRM